MPTEMAHLGAELARPIKRNHTHRGACGALCIPVRLWNVPAAGLIKGHSAHSGKHPADFGKFPQKGKETDHGSRIDDAFRATPLLA